MLYAESLGNDGRPHYSSQIVLCGAEFTRVYAKHRGSPLEPKENAVCVNRKGHV
jgi:hypothetical protein